MKRIVLLAARYSMNLGDDVIYDCVLDACKQVSGYETVGISISGLKGYRDKDDNGNIRKGRSIKDVLRSNEIYRCLVKIKGCFRILSTLKDLRLDSSDIIVFAGGQLFFDYFIPLLFSAVKYAKGKKIKVIFNCCGMGPINAFNHRLLKNTLSSRNVVSITIRDSEAMFMELFGKSVKRVQDPAINCNKVYSITHKEPSNKVGIGIIAMENLRLRGINLSYEDYSKIILLVIEICKRHDKEVELFTNGDVKDQKFLENLVAENNINGISIARRSVRPDALVNLINSYKCIFSFRLHSHIIASSYNIPTLGFVWDEKVSDFFTSINRNDFTVPLKGEIDYQAITKKVDELLITTNYKTCSLLDDSCQYLKDVIQSLE